jgi:hypothetical protein
MRTSSVPRATWSSETSASTEAVLWYLDGAVDKAPPPAPGGPASTPFDREVVAVLSDGSVVGVAAGSAEHLSVHAPPQS